jgi:probable HAF family extracellular repeat protein
MSLSCLPRRRVRASAAVSVGVAAALLSVAAPASAAATLPARGLAPQWTESSSVTAVNDVGQAIVSRTTDPTTDYLWTAGRFTPLTYQGQPFDVAALNNRGQVVGTAQTASGPIAVRWEAGHATALTLPGDNSLATDINDRGQITAISVTFSTSPPTVRGYLITGGTARDLGVGLSLVDEKLAINNSGQVAGNAVLGSGGAVYGLPTAFLWSGGHLSQLPTLGGDSAVVTDLNNRGQIVGRASLANGDQHAALWSGGTITDLGTLGGTYSSATALNELGQVAGSANTAAGQSQAVVWTGGHLKSLGTPADSWAVDLNNFGQIIAYAAASTPGTNIQRGYVWRNGTLTELGTLGAPFVTPAAINDQGLIVGSAQLPSGADEAATWNAGVG